MPWGSRSCPHGSKGCHPVPQVVLLSTPLGSRAESPGFTPLFPGGAPGPGPALPLWGQAGSFLDVPLPLCTPGFCSLPPGSMYPPPAQLAFLSPPLLCSLLLGIWLSLPGSLNPNISLSLWPGVWFLSDLPSGLVLPLLQTGPHAGQCCRVNREKPGPFLSTCVSTPPFYLSGMTGIFTQI